MDNCILIDGPFGYSVECSDLSENKKPAPADSYTDKKQAPPLPKGTDCFKMPMGIKCR